MDPSQFAGSSWDTWANHVESHRDEPVEPIVKVESSVNKLRKEDMKIFGLSVDIEPLELIVCEGCELLVKPQALHQHYAIKHNGYFPSKKNSPKVVERKESPTLVSSLIEPTSENAVVITHKSDSMSEIDLVCENVKDKSNLLPFPKMESKRLKRLETNRSPLGQMCTNRWHYKRKVSPAKNKSKVRSFTLMKSDSSLPQEQMETSSGSSLQTNDGVNFLLHRLPEMSLNTVEEEEVSAVNGTGSISYTDSVAFISRLPRAMSSAPWFSCHKVGGLYYPGRHMKVTCQSLRHLFNHQINNINILQHIKARRKNTTVRQMKSNDNIMVNFK